MNVNHPSRWQRPSGVSIDTYKHDAQASVSEARTEDTRMRVVLVFR